MFQFCSNIIKGIFLGAGAIIPGISSGVLCVIFGIYEKLVHSILGIFKDFKNNFKFLLPLFIGGGIGILLFGNSLKYVFNNFPMQANFAFMGLIFGTTPILIKKANTGTFKLHYLIYSLATFLASIILLKYESSCISSTISNYSSSYLVICGFFMSIGVVVPGVSSTVILMILGIYYTYLDAISGLNLQILVPLGIGLILGSIIWLNIIQKLLSKFHSQTFYSIIGFVFGSILIMYPGLTPNFNGIFSLFLFIICLFISFLLNKKEH